MLEAPAYEGGTLDWDDLRAAPADRSLGAAGLRWVLGSLFGRMFGPDAVRPITGGVALTVGGAYVHDKMESGAAKPLVNWDNAGMV